MALYSTDKSTDSGWTPPAAPKKDPSKQPSFLQRPETALGVSAGFEGVAALGNAFAQSQALAAQADYTEKLYAINSRIAEFQARDAIDQGAAAAGQVESQARQVRGSQRAGFAGQGVDVNSGSAQALQSETRSLSALDEITIRNNAYREAAGYKLQAISYTGQGRMAQIGGSVKSTAAWASGAITAGSKAAEAGYFFKKGY